ncbi:MAG: lysine--tRNA ligase [Thermoprotei archaeon]
MADNAGGWIDDLASSVMKVKGKHVIASAITTSGPTHLGTVEEFFFPSVVSERLKEMGDDPDFIFIGDVMDAFDSVPAGQKGDLAYYLGKPLISVPDPYGCHKSFGEHFLQETVDFMHKLGVSPRVIPVNKLYSEGQYDEYAKIFFTRLDDVKQILERTSLKKLPPSWKDVIMPICEKCGNIATTRVTGFDGEYVYYADDKDVGYAKGCGHQGKIPLSSHQWKMPWRLDWPTRQAFLGVTLEGAGKDHHTKGGSWDTAEAIHREILNRDPPITYRWGFVLLNGKKMSKSQGIGSLSTIVKYVPPEVLKYFLLRVDIEKDKNLDDSGEGLLKLIEEFEENLKRPRDPKKQFALHFSSPSDAWEVPFVSLLLAYQIERIWEGTKKRVGIKSDYLRPYVEAWVNGDKLPEIYRINYRPSKQNEGIIYTWLSALNGTESGFQASQKLREVAQQNSIQIESAFSQAYAVLIGRPNGPRLSSLIDAIGLLRIKNDVIGRLRTWLETDTLTCVC